jgi:hypothetical protein
VRKILAWGRWYVFRSSEWAVIACASAVLLLLPPAVFRPYSGNVGDIHAGLTLSSVTIGVSAAVLSVIGIYGVVRRWLGNRLRPTGAILVAIAMVASTLAFGAELRWQNLLLALFSLALSGRILFGSDIQRRLLERRRSSSYLSHGSLWFASLTRCRNSWNFGTCIGVVGLACIGGTPAHACIPAAAMAWSALAVLRFEDVLRKSGEASRMTPAFWNAMTAGAVLLALISLWVLGSIMARDIRLATDMATSTLVVQALLGSQVAVAGLALAATAVAIQVRSDSYGSEVATALVDKRLILLGAILLAGPIVGLTLLLANWSSWASTRSGLYVDLNLVASGCSLIGLCLIGGSVFVVLSRPLAVAEKIPRLLLSSAWPYELRVFAWNAPRRSLPREIHLLERALVGAWHQGDIELFTDVLENWCFYARAHPFVATMTSVFPAQGKTYFEAWKDVDLRWEDAHSFDGLDIALGRLVSNVSIAVRHDADFVRTLCRLPELVFPPYSRSGRVFPSVFPPDVVPPGFLLLSALTLALIQVKDWDSLENLVFRDWSKQLLLTIYWSERMRPLEREFGSIDAIDVVEQAVKLLVRISAAASRAGDSETAHAIVGVLIRAGAASADSGDLLAILQSLGELHAYEDPTWWAHLEELSAICAKQQVPKNWVLHLLDEASKYLLGHVTEVNSWRLSRFMKCYISLSTTVSVFREIEAEVSQSHMAALLRLNIEEFVESLAKLLTSFAELDPDKIESFSWWGRGQFRVDVSECLANMPVPLAQPLRDSLVRWIAEHPRKRGWLTLALAVTPKPVAAAAAQ